MNTIVFLTSIKKMENLIKFMNEHPILYVVAAILFISAVKFYVIDKIIPPKKSGNELERQSDKLDKIRETVDSVIKRLDDYYERNQKAAEGLVFATGFLDSLDDDTIKEFKAYIGNEIDLENMRIKMMEALEISVTLGNELRETKEKLLNSDPLANKKELTADFEKIDEHIMIVKNTVSSTDFIKLSNFLSKYIEERVNLLNS